MILLISLFLTIMKSVPWNIRVRFKDGKRLRVTALDINKVRLLPGKKNLTGPVPCAHKSRPHRYYL